MQRYIIIDGKTKGEIVISDLDIGAKPIIRPLSLKTTAKCSGNEVSVKIEKSCNFAIDFVDFEIFVFAYGEREVNKDEFKNVIYFEKGIHNPELMTIEEDDTLVYAEDGAIVHGCVVARNVNNITMAGVGVFTMEKYERGENVYLDNCRNICVRDLTFCDSSNWNMVLWTGRAAV